MYFMPNDVLRKSLLLLNHGLCIFHKVLLSLISTMKQNTDSLLKWETILKKMYTSWCCQYLKKIVYICFYYVVNSNFLIQYFFIKEQYFELCDILSLSKSANQLQFTKFPPTTIIPPTMIIKFIGFFHPPLLFRTPLLLGT